MKVLFLKGDLLHSFVVQVCLFHLVIMQKGGLVGLRKAKLVFLMSKRRNWIEDSVLIVHPN